MPSGKFAGYAVVVDPGTSGEGPRPLVVTAERQARRLSLADFPTPVVALTRLKVPRNFSSRNPQMRRDLASALRSRTHDLAPPPPSVRRSSRASAGERASRPGDEVDRLRADLRDHPCHDCPEREDHARWAERWFKLDKESRTLRRRVEERTNTVARQFDRVCEVLTELGYLEGATGEVRVTERGQRLMRLYSDLDLVTAEALRTGVFDELPMSGVAAALSVLVFEARRPDDDAPRVPGGPTREAIDELGRLAGRVQNLEKQHRLDFTRQPDLGFAWATYRWAEGDDLDEVLSGPGGLGLAAGDFVRWMKQVIDLAGPGRRRGRRQSRPAGRRARWSGRCGVASLPTRRSRTDAPLSRRARPVSRVTGPVEIELLRHLRRAPGGARVCSAASRRTCRA